MLARLQSLLGHRDVKKAKKSKKSKTTTNPTVNRNQSEDNHPSTMARRRRVQVQESISARAEFLDEVGGKRFAQIPAWLSSESWHQPVRIVDTWSTACRSDLTVARSAFQEEKDDQKDFKVTFAKRGSLERYTGFSQISRMHK